MVTRTRLLALALVTVVGSAGFAVASTVGERTVQQPTQVERVHRYYRAGPSAEYAGDSGGIGQVRPLRFETVAGAPPTAIVEASFGYRTRGPGPFRISLGMREVDGPRVTVRPGVLVLAPAPEGASTTVRFLAPDLADSASYEALLSVNSVFRDRGRNVVRTRAVVLTVDLS